MLKIRLKKLGKKKHPFYRVVVMKALSKRDGKVIAQIGYYNPLMKKIQLDKLKLFKYILNGAYPSDTVRYLIYKTWN